MDPYITHGFDPYITHGFDPYITHGFDPYITHGFCRHGYRGVALVVFVVKVVWALLPAAIVAAVVFIFTASMWWA